jgi:hypothetical protein
LARANWLGLDSKIPPITRSLSSDLELPLKNPLSVSIKKGQKQKPQKDQKDQKLLNASLFKIAHPYGKQIKHIHLKAHKHEGIKVKQNRIPDPGTPIGIYATFIKALSFVSVDSRGNKIRD